MESTPLLGSSGIRGRIARLPLCGKMLNRLLEVPSPFFHKNSPATVALRHLVTQTFQKNAQALVLNIGSRSKHKENILNLDIMQNGDADIIADATYMPFADNTFDLIINVAVMEHTKFPHSIASELGCLKTPFLG